MHNELRDYIIGSLKKNYRLDGRGLTDYRQPITVEYGVTKTAEGSARVRIGDTEVIAGVKLELGTPYPDTPDQGAIICGAELLPLSSPEFELGPPGIEAIELARVVDRGIRESNYLDVKSLCVKEGEKVWIVIIDICTINDAGNLMDASALAAVAALKDTRFPKVEDDQINYKEKTETPLPLTAKEPIAVTVCKIGDCFIVDPDTEEKKAIDARLTVTTTADGKICSLQKGEDFPLTQEDIGRMVDIGFEKAKELRGML